MGKRKSFFSKIIAIREVTAECGHAQQYPNIQFFIPVIGPVYKYCSEPMSKHFTVIFLETAAFMFFSMTSPLWWSDKKKNNTFHLSFMMVTFSHPLNPDRKF
jgi:uncharacterized protein with WD repeat